MKQSMHHWNQPEEQVEGNHSYSYFWNPSRGNVRVGNKEIKWFNIFK